MVHAVLCPVQAPIIAQKADPGFTRPKRGLLAFRQSQRIGINCEKLIEFFRSTPSLFKITAIPFEDAGDFQLAIFEPIAATVFPYKLRGSVALLIRTLTGCHQSQRCHSPLQIPCELRCSKTWCRLASSHPEHAGGFIGRYNCRCC